MWHSYQRPHHVYATTTVAELVRSSSQSHRQYCKGCRARPVLLTLANLRGLQSSIYIPYIASVARVAKLDIRSSRCQRCKGCKTRYTFITLPVLQGLQSSIYVHHVGSVPKVAKLDIHSSHWQRCKGCKARYVLLALTVLRCSQLKLHSYTLLALSVLIRSLLTPKKIKEKS